ncbi:MAG TPA: hypothetical protein VI078_06775 [bacterium]
MRRLEGVLALFALLLAPAVCSAQGTGVIKGKVTSEGKALEGAKVFLYKGYAAGFRGPGDYEAGPTAADGLFEARLPPGKYFVVARKAAAGPAGELAPGDYFAYYGGNPVLLGEGTTINLGINCSPIIGTGENSRPGGTGIRGTVYQDGAPLDRARVTLYQDGESIFRGIGYASVLTDPRGAFSFNLEEGKYYVVARKRAGDDRMGPLGEGGLFGFAHLNPVEVRKDAYTLVSINTSTKLVKVKEGGQDITLGGTAKAGETVVAGVVRDAAGKPVAGVYASAFRDSMMTQKPDFIALTGADGSFAIDLPEGGEYFIGARNTIGGPAERGDLQGWYAGTEDHSVKIKTGEKLRGIDIVVNPVE